MLKKTLIIALLLICGLSAFGQSKPRIGILPFTGGPSGDGDVIATLIGYQNDIQDAFTLVPLTHAVKAEVGNYNFQLSGIIDSDEIARLGRMLHADFVISGHIRRVGSKNLVIFSIINVHTFEMLAGAYRQYETLDDIPAMLPEIMKNFVSVSRSRYDISTIPRMTVAPLTVTRNVNSSSDAETLSQVVVIEIANSGKYVLIPRMFTNRSMMRERDFESMGRAVKAQYVLNIEASAQASSNMIAASIYDIEGKGSLPGGYQTYYGLQDGVTVAADLALILIGGPPQAPVEAAPPPPPPPPPPPSSKGTDPRQFWTIGFDMGTGFNPWGIASVFGTIAPLNYSFLELGCDAGLFYGGTGVPPYSIYPHLRIGIFLPFGKSPTAKGGWYLVAGAGCMMEFWTDPNAAPDKKSKETNAVGVDVGTGFNLWNFLNISYTFTYYVYSWGETLPNDSVLAIKAGMRHKLTLGFCYRF